MNRAVHRFDRLLPTLLSCESGIGRGTDLGAGGEVSSEFHQILFCLTRDCLLGVSESGLSLADREALRRIGAFFEEIRFGFGMSN